MLTYRRSWPCSSRTRRSSRGPRVPPSSRTCPRAPPPATVSFDSPPASARRTPGTTTVTAMSAHHRRPDAQHVGQVCGDGGPRVALIAAGVDLTRPGAEVDPGHPGVVERERVAQHGRVE